MTRILHYKNIIFLLGILIIGCNTSNPTSPPINAPESLIITGGSGGTIEVGQTAALTATVNYKDGTSKDVTQEAIWSSTDLKFAEVNKGIVKGIAVGNVEITVQFSNITSASKTLSIVANPVSVLESVTITGNASVQVQVDATIEFVAMANYADRNSVDVTQDAVWNSSLPSIASVIKGSVIGLVAGDTNITAVFNSKTSNTINVTVTATPPASAITWYTSANWAAFQDGVAGTWTTLVKQNDHFSITVTDTTDEFAIAATYIGEFGSKEVDVRYLSTSDVINKTIGTAPIAGTVTGKFTITGENNGDMGYANIAANDEFTYSWARTDPDVPEINISQVLPGTNDLFANLVFGTDLENFETTRFYLARDINIATANNSNINFDDVSLTFDAAPADIVTIIGLDSGVDNSELQIGFTTSRGTELPITDRTLLSTDIIAGESVVYNWRGLPAINTVNGELYDLENFSYSSVNGVDTYVAVLQIFSTLGNKTVEIPAGIDPNSIAWSLTTTATAAVLPKIDLSIHSDEQYGSPVQHEFVFSQKSLQWNIIIPDTRIESVNNSATYTTPDFSALSGWDDLYSLVYASNIEFSYASWHGNSPYKALFNDSGTDGAIVNIVGISLNNFPPQVGIWKTNCFQSAGVNSSVQETFSFIDGNTLTSFVDNYDNTDCTGTLLRETRKANYQLGNPVTTTGSSQATEFDIVFTESDNVPIPVVMQENYYQILFINNNGTQLLIGSEDAVNNGSSAALRPKTLDLNTVFIKQ